MVQKLSRVFLFLLLFPLVNLSQAANKRQILLSYFEGGKHPAHDLLRHELEQQFQSVFGDSITPIFIPQGFRSANWNRDSSRIYAKQLVGVDRADAVIAVGPWAAEDLLAAGYKKPIIAMYRYYPEGDNLLSQTGQPKATNLTVTGLNNVIERDLVTLIRLTKPKRIAALFFHDSGSGEEAIAQMHKVCEQFHIELQVEESYNNFGTFAFFAALKKIGHEANALYLGPLWGMDAIKVDEFLRTAKSEHLPAFSTEGSYMVDHGAFASNSGYTYLTEARVAAIKLLRIMHGERPCDLPVFVDAPTGLSLNLQTVSELGTQLPFEAVNEAILYGSDIPATSDIYSLNQAVYRATTTHPTALAAEQNLNAAIQNSKSGIGAFDPQLGLQVDVMHRSDEYVNNSHDWLKNDGVHGELGFEATLLSIENLRRNRVAQATVKAEEADRAAALGDLETATALAYAANVQTDALVKLYQESRLAIERNLELEKMTRSFEQTTDETNQIQWETQRFEVMTKLTTAYHDRKRARILLNTLLNLPVTTPILLDSTQFSEGEMYDNYLQLRTRIMTPTDEMKLRELLLGEAQKTNPEFARIGSSATIAQENTAVLSRKRWPSFGVFAKGLYTNEQADIPDEFTEKDFSWTVGARLRWSLLGPFADRQKQRQLQAEQQAKEYEKDSMSLALLSGIQNGVSNLVEQMNNVPISIKWRKSALLQYQNSARAYEAGQASVNDVIMAHDDAERASVQATEERFDYYRQLAALTNQLGWQSASTQGTYVTEFFRRIGAGQPAPPPPTPQAP